MPSSSTPRAALAQQAIMFLVLLFLGLFTLRSNKLIMNGEFEKDVERSGRGMF